MEFFNHLQVMQSGRFVYGPSADFALAEKLLAACPEAKHITSKSTMSKMGQVPRNDRMPPGTWLVVGGARTSYRCPLQSWGDVDGDLQVCVTLDGWETFQQILQDPPYSQIGIFQDGTHSRYMRDVSIEPVSGKPTTVLIAHTHPGVRAIMRDHGRRQTASAPAR